MKMKKKKHQRASRKETRAFIGGLRCVGILLFDGEDRTDPSCCGLRHDFFRMSSASLGRCCHEYRRREITRIFPNIWQMEVG